MTTRRYAIALALFASLPVLVRAETPVDFARDIRPILSDKCYRCHGPDGNTRKADLRLDTEDGAKADLGGYSAVVPGQPDKSELVRRITTDLRARRMPPAKSEKQLTSREIDLLRRWVAQGAKWDRHWAFVPPKKATPPITKTRWGHNPIDKFVLARLEREGLSPSPEADRETLLRRATLTLTGLPPTPDEVNAFLKDAAPNAYEKVVDRLLKSERYGERMAWFWLDAARYADTDGYQVDSERTMWPWRDWVIKAFDDNMPFDRFTIEQLAGDMLPSPTPLQRLASGFNRNHRLNAEGGALPEEFIVEYAIDRVETTSTVWLGLTAGCARCHDHKFDPISQKEFYSLFGYFNNIAERGTGRGTKAPPTIQIGSSLVRPSKDLVAKLNAKKKALADLTANDDERQAAWEKREGPALVDDLRIWGAAIGANARTEKGGSLACEPTDSYHYSGKNMPNDTYILDFGVSPDVMKKLTALRIETLSEPYFGKPIGFARSVNGNFVLTSLTLEVLGKNAKKIEFSRADATHSQPNYHVSGILDPSPAKGWAVANPPANSDRIDAMVVLKEPLRIERETKLRLRLVHGSKFANHNIGNFRIALSESATPKLLDRPLSRPLLQSLKKPASARTDDEASAVHHYFRSIDPDIAKLEREIRELEAVALGNGPKATVMVMQEKPSPTPTYLLKRGQYDDPDKSEVLPRRLPESLHTGKQPTNRLELAKWLVSDENPLTARVIVNRIWQQHFGRGLVTSAEDFGSQGQYPTHPELLDWLAVEFRFDWNLKRLHKLILTSATYGQSSKTTRDQHRLNPTNELLSRGPRFRLDGAAIRDIALFASGLLDGRRGGPPVKPYQPAGLWNVLNSNQNFRYSQSKGSDLYRRSLYTFWKRTVAPPRQLIFDASGREACNVRTRVTNTPLQALVLMNDPTFVEAARALAERMMKSDSTTATERLAFGYRLATGRSATPRKLAVFVGNYQFFRTYFEEHPDKAKAFLSVGESKRDMNLRLTEHAAFASTAHLILNLDETITLE